MGVILSTCHTDKPLNQTLSNLGAFGGLLSAVCTVILTVVAIIGLNTWSKQLKNGKFLTAIWEEKVSICKLNNKLSSWHAFYKSGAEGLKELSEKNETEIHSCLNKLDDLSYQLDALSSQNKETWQRNSRALRMRLNDHKQYLDSTDFSNLDAENHATEAKYITQLCDNENIYCDHRD